MSHTHEILARLIGFNTVSANSNLEIINYIQGFLNDRGFAVHLVPDDSGQKAGLFASIGPAGRGVMVSGHTDVVPIDGQNWSKDPFVLTQEAGRLYGRGTTDMKGYVACVMALADRASRVDLKEPLKISLSYDEEIGCVGIQHMIGALERTIGLPRACFVGEPTEMQVAIGHKGKGALRANCYGLSGHSALAPRFANALHLAGDLMAELRALQDDLAANGARDSAYDIPYSTIHIGKMSGGVALNIVPDQAEIVFEYRHLATDSAEDLRARILQAGARVQAAHQAQFAEAKIEISQYNAYPGLDVAASADASVYAQRLAQSRHTTKVAFGTEAGVFARLGVPTVVCGPGSMAGQGHKPDEYVTLAQLAACDAMLDRLLDDLKA